MPPFLEWLVPSAASLFGGIFSSVLSHDSSMEQIAAQRHENALNRNFNMKEASKARQFSAEQSQIARDYNTSMVNAQNEYNNPTNQMARLRAAGLNPNMIYQSLGNSSVGVGSTSMVGSSASASSSGSVGTSLPDYSGILAGLRTAAEIGVMKSQVRKNDSESELNEISAKYRDQIEKGNVDFLGVNIQVAKDKTKAEIEKMAQDMAESQKRCDEIGVNIRLKSAQEASTVQTFISQLLDNKIKSATLTDVIRQVKASAKLTEEQASMYVRATMAQMVLSYSAANLNAQKVQESKETIKEIQSRVKINQQVERKTRYEADTAKEIKRKTGYEAEIVKNQIPESERQAHIASRALNSMEFRDEFVTENLNVPEFAVDFGYELLSIANQLLNFFK